MPHKRSRANTEQRFQDAVLELVGESGCAHLGVNVVAQRAGSDKVLIYRYFEDLDGLLQRVATSRSWLPTANELLGAISGSPKQILEGLFKLIVHHIKSDAATHQLSRWRHAVKNPLTEQFNSAWKHLWSDLKLRLGQGLGYEARQNWDKACGILALGIQAELNGDGFDLSCLDLIAGELEVTSTEALLNDIQDEEDILPTNLL